MIEYVIRRCQMSARLGGVMLATSTQAADDPLELIATGLGVRVFRGSETDVLERYLGAAAMVAADVVVRITGDCPLIAPEIIDDVVDAWNLHPADYGYIKGYPNGLGAAEVLRVRALERARDMTTPADTYYREHVMTYLTDCPDQFTLNIWAAPDALTRPDLRLSVDEPADLEVICRICDHFAPRMNFSAREIIEWLTRNPGVAGINSNVRQKLR